MQTDNSEQMEGELRCEEEKNCSGWSLQGVYPKYVYAQTVFTLFLIALRRSRTEPPLYDLNFRRSAT